MQPFLAAYVASMLFSAVVASVLAANLLRRRTGRGRRWLALSLSGIALWTATQSFSVAASTRAASVFWLELTFVGSAVAGLGLLLFTLAYTGRGNLITPGLVGLLALEPAVLQLLVFTTERHSLVHERVALDPETGHLLVVEHGPFFFVHLAYMSIILAVSTVLLLQLCYRARNLYRGQAVAILAALALPWAGTLVDGIVSPPMSVTEPSFAVSVVALWVGLFWYDLIEVPPVARARVVETLSEGVLVVNERDLLVDINPAATELLSVDESVVGEAVHAALSDHPELQAVVDADAAPSAPVPVETIVGERHVEVERTTLGGGSGAVYLLQEVTDRIERERTLERKNERLDSFAGVVSHDLRNPLNVAQGYVELLGEHVDDPEADAYLSEAQASHERMSTIVDDVLALAREGESVENPTPVALAHVADDAWSQVETRDATLDVDLDLTVPGDRGQLQRSFENLFRNSVEHGGRTVHVRVGSLPDGFFVEDDGPGIPPTERERVLDSGYSGHDTGTGLGLAIVDGVARTHGWDLTITDAPAGGARFEIRGVDTDGDVDDTDDAAGTT